MDQASRQMLDEILAKEPAALTDGDKDFLRARSSYLNEEQKAIYAGVLGEQPQAEGSEEIPAEPAEQKAAQPKARRGRKASEESEA